MSSSFNYAPEVVDLDAMNITEMFPEASSFSFDMSSFNHSYTDSISGVPLAQQALWDDGQLSLPPTVNSSRIIGQSALSSLNNSANNSFNHGPLSRHLLAPSSHHLRPPSLLKHQQYLGSPLGGAEAGHDFDQSQYDEYNESSLQHGWVDETRDQNGIMLLNDKDRQDEQHLLFLQDIGAAGNISRGDSISLFTKLADETDLSCDLFKEELEADETRDQSRLQSEQFSGMAGPSVAGNRIGNEIFDQAFLASLRTPLVSQPPPRLESAKNGNFFENLYTITAPAPRTDDDILKSMNIISKEGDEGKDRHEVYQQALKSFFDSLKIADPIKTPHKFAPQPLPILWNEPKIRSKALPSFNLADYKDTTKAAAPTKTLTPSTSLPATMLTTPPKKQDSLSTSPTDTFSIPNSAHSSPLSSMSTSSPVANTLQITLTPKTSTTEALYPPSPTSTEESLKSNQSPDSAAPNDPSRDRSRRRLTALNPHLAFDPTIPPAEREVEESHIAEPKYAKNTLERRSTIQQQAQAMAQSNDQETQDPRSSPPLPENDRRGSIKGTISPTITSGLRGPTVRKRQSLHQDMFLQEQIGAAENIDDVKHEAQQQIQEDDLKQRRISQDESKPEDEFNGRRGSIRPLSMNILPESLTSMGSHALNEQEDISTIGKVRRQSEDEDGEGKEGRVSRLPGTLSLGRTTGTRYVRSGSNGSASGGSTTQLSPTTPTLSNPYGSLKGRTMSRPNSQRLSMSGLSGMYTKTQQPTEDAQKLSMAPSPMKSPSSTISGSGSRSSPPSALPELRRSSATIHQPDTQLGFDQLAPDHYHLEEFYGDEQQQWQSPRSSRLYHQEDEDHGAEWYGQDVPEHRGLQEQKARVSYQAPSSSLDQQQEQNQQQQREQHQQQRLRIQQQAREEVYGRGYGNGYADEVEDAADDYPQNYRYSQPSTTIGARTGSRRSSPSSLSPTATHSTTAAVSRYPSDHYRRQSKDGYSLMPAPRISPPLTNASSTTVISRTSPNGNAPRRSLSNITGSVLPTSSRRLSNAANVGTSSSLGYGSNYSGSNPALHGRSVSSGSGLTSHIQRSSAIGQGQMSSSRHISSASDGILPGNSPRRAFSTIVSPNRRTSSSSTSNGYRASTIGASASPEYARVFNPPRASAAPSLNGYGYSNNSSSHNRQYSDDDHLQRQDTGYSYRPEVPTRQSSLGVGAGAGHKGVGLGLSSRNSTSTLRSSSGSHLLGGAPSSSMSSLSPRRTASISVAAGGGGHSALGRPGGILPGRQQYQQYQQEKQQQQQQQQQSIQPQRYQRTSMYSYR
ncbi:hypothetical protein BG011_002622 [Mortierella polycephala]|uniref:Uncharacterized protein n=1 Tax=Mortierella polycephala TaxID=41804 RepID=A0A9P6Q2Y0_9FUNG|nr:hypothetical protein BG011_002622 [Mortierella polycephala]